MSPLNIDFFLNLLFHDDEFVSSLETAIEQILKDGKLDHYDIPSILVIIVQVINNYDKIKFTLDELSTIVKKILDYVVSKYSVPIDEEEKQKIADLVEASLKLAFLQPKFVAFKKKWLSLSMSCIHETFGLDPKGGHIDPKESKSVKEDSDSSASTTPTTSTKKPATNHLVLSLNSEETV